MKIHIRVITNDALLNKHISRIESYCNENKNCKIIMFQTQLYWKENMLREGELCLDIDNELSIEDCVNIITTLFKLKIDDVNVAETDDSYNIDVYENLDNLLCFPDRLALFTYINKIEK